MKDLQESDVKLNHLVMGAATRLLNRNGAQCVVLLGRSQSDAANDAVFEVGRVG